MKLALLLILIDGLSGDEARTLLKALVLASAETNVIALDGIAEGVLATVERR